MIGMGPIGCEMTQAFRRLGSEVVALDAAKQILSREDADAAAIVQERFDEEGIQLVLGCQVERVEQRAAVKVIHAKGADGSAREIAVDEILVGVGRAPNIQGPNLDAVGVECNESEGVKVDDHLRTTNPRIYAAGDVCMGWKFTHAPDAATKIVVRNAPFLGRKKLSALVMP